MNEINKKIVHDLESLPQSLEKGLYITHQDQLSAWNPLFTRLYYGNELCEERIPAIIEIEDILHFVKGKNIDFTFMTCRVTDRGIERYKEIAEYFIQACSDKKIEVIINDWGLLNVFEDVNCFFTLGRLMVQQERDSRLLKVLPYKDECEQNVFSAVGMSEELRVFCKDNNITGFIIDNVLQGVSLEEDELDVSVFFPYVYCSSLHTCVGLGLDKQEDKQICKHDCARYHMVLENPEANVSLVWSAKGIFYVNDKIHNLAGNVYIKKIIFQPFLPE